MSDDADDVLQQKQVARMLVEGLLNPDRVAGVRGPDAAHGIDFVHALAHAVTDADHPQLARCVCATLLALVEARARLVQLVDDGLHASTEGTEGTEGRAGDLVRAQIARAHGVHALAIGAHFATSAARAAQAATASACTAGRHYPGLDLALTLFERGVPFVRHCWGLPLAECSAACRADAQRFLVAGLCNLRHVAVVAGGLSTAQRRLHADTLAAVGRMLHGVLDGRQELCALLAAAVHYVSRDEQAAVLRAAWAPVAADLLLTAHEHGDGPKVLWCVLQGLVGDADSAACIGRGCAAFKAAAFSGTAPVSGRPFDKCLPILGELEVMCRRFGPCTEHLCCWFKLKDLVCAVAWDFPGIVGEVGAGDPGVHTSLHC